MWQLSLKEKVLERRCNSEVSSSVLFLSPERVQVDWRPRVHRLGRTPCSVQGPAAWLRGRGPEYLLLLNPSQPEPSKVTKSLVAPLARVQGSP